MLIYCLCIDWQLDGQFKFAESDQDFVTLNLSKYGMKILEKPPQDRYQVPTGMRPPQVRSVPL